MRMNETAENVIRLNCKIVGDLVFELNAANSTIATNNILKVLGCAAEILPALVRAAKKKSA